jgi:hypothetical protein
MGDHALVIRGNAYVLADVASARQLLRGGAGQVSRLNARLIEAGSTYTSRSHVG